MKEPRQGLLFARFLMTLSSLSPLFVLWAVRGTELVPDSWFVPGCLAIALLPTVCLVARIWMAKKQNDKREIVVGSVDDHGAHVLVYLFAILLPFYREHLATCRDLLAMILALTFIIAIFMHLNLHYLNLWLALTGYRAFTILPPVDKNPYSGKVPLVFITRRRYFAPAERISALRITNSVYLECED